MCIHVSVQPKSVTRSSSIALPWLQLLRLYDFLAGAVTRVYGLGLVEAAAVEHLVEESQSSEGEDGEDEEEQDYKAGDVPAVMEREHLLHRSGGAVGQSHVDLGDGNKEGS